VVFARGVVIAAMAYNGLAELLATDDAPRVVTFPDGSVDVYYAAFDERGERIEEREAFGDRIVRGTHESIPVERESREAGGQAVNMAKQAHALGAETVCYGHLDDPVFADLPMQTVSMGDPSQVSVFQFDDEDLLLAERSADVTRWTTEAIETADTAASVSDALAADAVCCGNWASVDGLTDAIATLAAAPLDATTFVLDPGSVRVRPREALSDLLAALGELDARTEVVYSVNRTELEGTVDAIEPSTRPSSDGERLALVRETAGITAAVLHETDVAAVATRDGETIVETLDVADPRRRTGAGDRFSAGVAVGRARSWPWETALALGNVCAAYAVETASTGDKDALQTVLRRAA